MSYISVQGLCKHFDVRQKREKGSLLRKKERVQALQDVSFDVEQGELVGYIGPNGAGKSTTVKILSGIMVPDSGIVSVGGLTPWENRKEHVRRIGVVFGQRMQLWWDVPIADSYDLLKDIYRIPDSEYRQRLDELTEALENAGFSSELLTAGKIVSDPESADLERRFRKHLLFEEGIAELLYQPVRLKVEYRPLRDA